MVRQYAKHWKMLLLRAAARTVPAPTVFGSSPHMAAWTPLLRVGWKGIGAQLTDDENWPPITEMNEQPGASKEPPRTCSPSLVTAVRGLDEVELECPYSRHALCLLTLHGVISTPLYHTGQ